MPHYITNFSLNTTLKAMLIISRFRSSAAPKKVDLLEGMHVMG